MARTQDEGEGEGSKGTGAHRQAGRRLSPAAPQQAADAVDVRVDAASEPVATRSRFRRLFVAEGVDSDVGSVVSEVASFSPTAHGEQSSSPLKTARRAYGRVGLSVGSAKRVRVRPSQSQVAGGVASAGQASSPTGSPNPKRRKTSRAKLMQPKVVDAAGLYNTYKSLPYVEQQKFKRKVEQRGAEKSKRMTKPSGEPGPAGWGARGLGRHRGMGGHRGLTASCHVTVRVTVFFRVEILLPDRAAPVRCCCVGTAAPDRRGCADGRGRGREKTEPYFLTIRTRLCDTGRCDMRRSLHAHRQHE